MEHVICANCQKSFPDVYSETQAVGCTSDYISEKKSIFSHYGSCHDTSKYNVIDENFQEGVICDTCIDAALDKKQIVLDESFDYWEPVKKMQEQQAELYKNTNWKIVDSL